MPIEKRKPIECSLCGSLSEPTMNQVPDAGLVLEPYTWGGYSEFMDSLAISLPLVSTDPSNIIYCEEQDEQEVAETKRFFEKNKRFLCHNCVVELFRWLKIDPDPSHHEFVVPGVRCCEWGYNPISDYR